MRLVALGMLDLTGSASAMNRGVEVLDTLHRSSALMSLLRDGGPWASETDAFDRGVTVAPDLVGDRVVVEIKRITPTSFGQQVGKLRQQAEAYLAWAMVRNGLNDVVANWRATVANLHPDIPEAERLLTVLPRRELIGERVFRRHRLLAVMEGGWLPAPLPQECSYCEFSTTLEGQEALPPICQYYCQAERGWSCRSVDDRGAVCPLYEMCDQHSRYEPYERLDEFGRLRRILLIEEEESEVAVAVTERITRKLGPFRVLQSRDGGLTLKPEAAMGLVDAAVPGAVYKLQVSGETLGLARFRRLRDGNWCFAVDRTDALPQAATGIQLSATSGMSFPVRAQLAELDRLQRMGEEPFSVRRDAARGTAPEVTDYRGIGEVPSGVPCLIIDNPDPFKSREILSDVMKWASGGRALVLTGPETDFELLPPGIVQFDEFSTVERLSHESDRPVNGLQRVARECASATSLAVPWDLLFSGLLDPFVGSDRFQTVVVVDAHQFPLLGLRKCFDLASSTVVLTGSAIAAGPWAESAAARGSSLFQNGVRLLIETAGTSYRSQCAASLL